MLPLLSCDGHCQAGAVSQPMLTCKASNHMMNAACILICVYRCAPLLAAALVLCLYVCAFACCGPCLATRDALSFVVGLGPHSPRNPLGKPADRPVHMLTRMQTRAHVGPRICPHAHLYMPVLANGAISCIRARTAHTVPSSCCKWGTLTQLHIGAPI